MAVLAGVVQVGAGATCATQGVQLLTMFQLYSFMAVVPYVLLLGGAAQMALGATTSAGRDWAAIAGAVVAGGLALLAVAFLLYTLMGGIIVLAFVWAALGCLAAAVAPFAIPSCRAVSAARRELYR